MGLYIIGGKYKRRSLVVPKSDQVRPTTAQLREAVFNICQQEIEGANFLDLFAGSGAMGLEALSRGAAHATFVERNRLAQKAIEKNMALLQVEQVCSLYKQDVFDALEQMTPHTFDVIYIDPPYGTGISAPLLEQIDQRGIVRPHGMVFIEDAHFTPLHLTQLLLCSERKIGRAYLYQYECPM